MNLHAAIKQIQAARAARTARAATARASMHPLHFAVRWAALVTSADFAGEPTLRNLRALRADEIYRNAEARHKRFYAAPTTTESTP